ncbi:acetylcholinesterase-like [Paramacrobiotus metropolitanus]|uniref:acetylcholinesterase-like n=1 Tax=Paramacrobiotus metropolitanus TaxID=2943436 RepID=UPI002445EF35|nr:acetylcholinesterase-like [Paramacrobiotus metropolitanus]
MLCASLTLILCAVAILPANAGESTVDDGQVQLTPEIILTGEKYVCEKNPSKHGYAYYGIRYGNAKRFKPSEVNTDYSYLSSPTRGPKQGYVCPQHPMAFPGLPMRNLSMSEDCLYLDVYVPPISKEKPAAFPVLLWIHGGGFQFGEKDLYNATGLAAAIDAVVVTINYRLFAFGFLTTGDGVLKGNYGLGDVKTALKWVKQNIRKFDGNADAITILGESAGGALTSAAFLDKNVRENVRAAIAMSGSMLTVWAMNHDAKLGVVTLANLLGCPVNQGTASMAQCIEEAPFEKILNVSTGIGKNITMQFLFAPVVDGEQLSDKPAQMIPKQENSDSKANFITGFLREDSSLILAMMNRDLFAPNATFNHETAKKLVSNAIRLLSPCDLSDTVEQVLEQYKIVESDERRDLIRKVYHVTTDLKFGFPAIQEALLYANRTFSSSVPNQLYRISYDPQYQGLGSFHVLDVVLLFSGQLKALLANQTVDDQVVADFREMFRQVAHTGRIDGPDVGTEVKYMEFGQSGKWETGTDDFRGTVNFWSNIIQNSRNCSATKLKDISSGK